MKKILLSLVLLLSVVTVAAGENFRLMDGVYRDDYPFYEGCGFLEVSNEGKSLYYELREQCSDGKGENILYEVRPRFNGSILYIGDVVWELIKVTDQVIVGHWKGPQPGFAAKVPFRRVRQ